MTDDFGKRFRHKQEGSKKGSGTLGHQNNIYYTCTQWT